MNLLDENIPDSQRRLLVQRRVHVRQIGVDLVYKGIKDHEIIPLLHRLDRPTFFTFDDVDEQDAADFIRRTLRHHGINSRAKRMGTVVQVGPAGISLWRAHAASQIGLVWKSR